MNHQINSPEDLRTGSPASEAATDDAITRALSRKPAFAITEDFAARTAAFVIAQPQPETRRWLGWGPRLALGSGALLTAGMFALAPHAVPSFSNVPFDGELLLLAELSGLLLFSHRLLSRD